MGSVSLFTGGSGRLDGGRQLAIQLLVLGPQVCQQPFDSLGTSASIAGLFTCVTQIGLGVRSGGNQLCAEVRDERLDHGALACAVESATTRAGPHAHSVFHPGCSPGSFHFEP